MTPSATLMDGMTPSNPVRLLRLSDVLSRVPISKPTLYRAIRQGKFPRGCKLFDARGSAWSEAEISAWIAQRLASRG